MAEYWILNSERRRREIIEQIGRITIKLGVPLFEVTIRKYKKLRSLRQNALYWMWVEIIGNEQGLEKDEMHLVLRGEFLGYNTVEMKGRPYLVPISTSGLNTHQFTEYLDKIQAFAIQWGIKLPIPQDYQFIMGYDPQTGEVK